MNQQVSDYFKPPFTYQSLGRVANQSQLPGLGLSSLELSPQTGEVRLQARAHILSGNRYRVRADGWRVGTSVQSVEYNWLELPHGYPDVQFGAFEQPGVLKESSVRGQPRTYRVNFPQPFKSQPKVVTFLSQFYINKGSSYSLSASAEAIDLQGFTLRIFSSGKNPSMTTNFAVNWIAHREDSPWVDSGSFNVIIKWTSDPAGKVSFAHKKWTRPPAVLAGLTRTDFRA